MKKQQINIRVDNEIKSLIELIKQEDCYSSTGGTIIGTLKRRVKEIKDSQRS